MPYVCSICSRMISDQVYDYSMNHFNRALCLEHQEKERQGISQASRAELNFQTIPDETLLSLVQGEISDIRSFLLGINVSDITPQKLCFWVWFCYRFGLFLEGSLIFRKIDSAQISEEQYGLIKKMALVCENRRGLT
jgi:hypothetical protein